MENEMRAIFHNPGVVFRTPTHQQQDEERE